MHQLGLFLVRPKNNISFESNLNTSCILEYLYAKKKEWENSFMEATTNMFGFEYI